MAELLIKSEADPNFLSAGLSLPLIHAIKLAEESYDVSDVHDDDLMSIIKMLIRYGGDVNLTSYDGMTPYEYASRRYQFVKKLIESEIESGL
jgi:hypothetical protein